MISKLHFIFTHNVRCPSATYYDTNKDEDDWVEVSIPSDMYVPKVVLQHAIQKKNGKRFMNGLFMYSAMKKKIVDIEVKDPTVGTIDMEQVELFFDPAEHIVSVSIESREGIPSKIHFIVFRQREPPKPMPQATANNTHMTAFTVSNWTLKRQPPMIPTI